MRLCGTKFKCCGSELRDSQGGLLEVSELRWVLPGGPVQLRHRGREQMYCHDVGARVQSWPPCAREAQCLPGVAKIGGEVCGTGWKGEKLESARKPGCQAVLKPWVWRGGGAKVSDYVKENQHD